MTDGPRTSGHRSGEGGRSTEKSERRVRRVDLEGRKPEEREQQQRLPDTKCVSSRARETCLIPGIEGCDEVVEGGEG